MAKKNKSRRSFIAKSILTATGASVLMKTLKQINEQKADTIRVISDQGEVFEVDRKYVGKMCAGKSVK